MNIGPHIRRTHHVARPIIAGPGEPLLPELMAAVRHPQTARDRTGARLVQQALAGHLAGIENIPQITYTIYRDAQRKTDRLAYQNALYGKRARMSVAALQVLLGNDRYVDALHDYVWSVCEESTWVNPLEEQMFADLLAVATGFDLAEIIVALEDKLEARLIRRVRTEIDRRILIPYLERREEVIWYRGHNNWNGVCNGAIGAMFLLLEQDRSRLARALEIVMEGLEVFLETAFEPDGGSGEGAGYWQYGLSNFICFAEMLRHRTNGTIDLLTSERIAAIAAYPVRAMLSPGHYANFSDCNEQVGYHPGLMTRLAQRTGLKELLAVLAEPAPLDMGGPSGRFHSIWRDMFWWDGERPSQVTLQDAWLQDSQVVRLVAATPSGVPLVLAAKAGHNGVSHNHDDVGTFILHVGRETFLCDPGRGLYDLYRRYGRAQNVFCNSYGHSVPRIGSRLQSSGREFGGKISLYDTNGPEKRATMDIGGAYQVPGLARIQRSLRLAAHGERSGDLIVGDVFTFSGAPQPIEEALVTWLSVEVLGATAVLTGERHKLQVTIERPRDAVFSLQVMKEESKANLKDGVLKRLSYEIGPKAESTARIRATVLPL